jgi:signal transduction histidine kinase
MRPETFSQTHPQDSMAHLQAPKLPASAEQRRLAALRSYGILDTVKESAFEDITRIASLVCGTPIAVVNLIDADRQWFKSEVGLGVRETPLATSICAHAILEHDMLVVPDTTQDRRFAENPLVTGDPGLRFYAGALLKTADGLAIGTVCVLDTEPRGLSQQQIDVLRGLARQVMTQLELRRMLAASERQNKHLGSLVTAAGHDLKAPLRSALYAIDRSSSVSVPEVQARLAAATAQLLDIDRRLTSLSVAASSGVGLAPELTPVAIAPLFAAMEQAWQPVALRRNISFSVSPSTLSVIGHGALLETLVGNLLSNAMKYTPKGGSVHLEAERLGDIVEIRVTDTGIGMTTEASEELFGAFRQADPTADGLGLGLWIVQQTADALEATLSVHSAPGEGSRFMVRLNAG